MKSKPEKQLLETMWRDSANWKGKGIFSVYYNPNDSRLMVPKKNPACGWTCNFANPKAYIFVIAFLVIIVGFVMIAIFGK